MRIYRVINAVLFLLFAVFAIAQADGSDPLRAGIIYGTASLLCALAATNRAAPPLLTLLFAGLCGVLAVAMGLPGQPSRPIERALGWATDETGRRAIGLVVVALWMAVVARVSSRITSGSASRDR